MADNTEAGKLFVGGISRDTTEDTLTDCFTKYGVVLSSTIAKDRFTNLPRGFAFVTFSDPSSVDRALLHHHLINGRTVEVKRAIPRSEQQLKIQRQQQQQQPQPSPVHSQTSKGVGRNSNGIHGANDSDQFKKIFVGGLSANLTEEEFKGYFEQFGRINDVVVMHDNATNRPRGFGFITFDSEEVVAKIVQNSHHEVGGKRVEVKRAVPREATKSFNNGNNSRYGNGRLVPVAGNGTEESYWPMVPTYGSYPGPLPVSTSYPGYYYSNCGVYGGGYPFGAGYGFYGYGMTVVPPRSQENSFTTMHGRPVNYGTGYYPSGLDGGFPVLGIVNPYSSIMEPASNGRPAQNLRGNNQVVVKDAPVPLNGTEADGDASSLKMANGDANVKKHSRPSDAQAEPKVASAGQSG